MYGLNIDETLLRCVIHGTFEGLSMTATEPVPVGASRFITANRPYSVLVSLHGDQAGQLTLNFTEQMLRYLSAKLLGEEPRNPDSRVNEDDLDAICEIGNIVAGQYKKMLAGTPFEFQAISLPALIVGASYNLYHTRGIITVSVEFEVEELGVTNMPDKFFTSAISLLRKTGGPSKPAF